MTATENGQEALGAEAEQLDQPSWVTISWRGRVDTDHLFAFFNQLTDLYSERASAAPSADKVYSIEIFGPKESRHFNAGTNGLSMLKKKVPEGTNFVRLDFLNFRGALKVESDDFEPDLSVWSRVDLADVPVDIAEADRIGVWAAPQTLKSMSETLAKFVSATHIDHISKPVALSGMRKLLQNFSLA